MDKVSCVAVDLGASSGRVILSTFDGKTIELEEVYRFPNEPVEIGNRYYWDYLRLFRGITEGLKEAAKLEDNIVSIGIDTWGVDYGLIDIDGNLIGVPIHYRDDRTNLVVDEVNTIISKDEIYQKTGIQHMPINTIYQLYSDKSIRPNILNNAKSLLFMPDLFNFFLTGEIKNEYTIASTSQLINAKTKTWDMDMISRLNLPKGIFGEIIDPGKVYGLLKQDIADQIGLNEIPVIAVGAHDTASAVVGTPLAEKSAYLSSGTWSLLGVEIKEAIVSEKSSNLNFTNEGGVDDTIRLLKNINGLWIIQQMRKVWNREREDISFEDIIDAAKNADNNHFSIDPDDPRFMAPDNMVTEIVEYCIEQGQGRPSNLGEISIAVYNGLTSKYAKVINELEDLIGEKIEQINMVGGGTQDTFLCQMTADATGKMVVAGPIEASVLGNTIVQFIAGEYIENIQEGRCIIGDSFGLKQYKPSFI